MLRHLWANLTTIPTAPPPARPRWRALAWSIFAAGISVLYALTYTRAYLAGQTNSHSLAVVLYNLRAALIVGIGIWTVAGAPWRPATVREQRQERIMAHGAPWSHHCQRNYSRTQLAGRDSEQPRHRQPATDYSHSAAIRAGILIAGLLVRWCSGLVLAGTLPLLQTVLQMSGVAVGDPDWTIALTQVVFLSAIGGLVAFYARSLERALLTADAREKAATARADAAIAALRLPWRRARGLLLPRAFFL